MEDYRIYLATYANVKTGTPLTVTTGSVGNGSVNPVEKLFAMALAASHASKESYPPFSYSEFKTELERATKDIT